MTTNTNNNTTPSPAPEPEPIEYRVISTIDVLIYQADEEAATKLLDAIRWDVFPTYHRMAIEIAPRLQQSHTTTLQVLYDLAPYIFNPGATIILERIDRNQPPARLTSWVHIVYQDQLPYYAQYETEPYQYDYRVSSSLSPSSKEEGEGGEEDKPDAR